jgi:hypothetical protein
MPAAKQPECRRRAVELARLREKPIAQIANYCRSASHVCGARHPRCRPRARRTPTHCGWAVAGGTAEALSPQFGAAPHSLPITGRVRTPSHRRPRRGMITTLKLSG